MDKFNQYPFKDKKLSEDSILQLKNPLDFHMYAIRHIETNRYFNIVTKKGKEIKYLSRHNVELYRTIYNANFDFSRFNLSRKEYKIVEIKIEEVEEF